MSAARGRLPGFGLSLGTTLFYLGLIVFFPLAALTLKAGELGLSQILAILGTPRSLASIRITLTTAAAASAFNLVYGLAFAWVLARYTFPGKRLLDALVDIPFALPTAVAGLALTALFAKNGWVGSLLADIGITVVYTPLGIIIAMAFTSLPFVVRTLQPVIEELGDDVEEAARSLGASDFQILRRVIFPALFPALLSALALSFARNVGEFGAVIFIAGNQPLRTEVLTLLTFIRLEEFDYPAAAAIATTMLLVALGLLLVINLIQTRYLRDAT